MAGHIVKFIFGAPLIHSIHGSGTFEIRVRSEFRPRAARSMNWSGFPGKGILHSFHIVDGGFIGDPFWA